ncbi:MAG: biosynthetic arginine decarboxylase [Planctomycetes bacterium]|nr:biosynthetic arginine decarboxylase [Planctomycetota bacterium]
MDPWTPSDSANLYHVEDWGSDYFRVGPKGHLEVSPEGKQGETIDLFELVGQIQARGVQAPMLIRFDGILRDRVRRLHGVFNRARREFDYDAPYRAVYPIKVNQDRLVAECLLEEGRAHGMGLEVGSKPELVAGIALQAGEGSLLICNGYKDQEYVEMAMLSSQLGITPILVIEKFTELQTIINAHKALGIRPVLGVRSKLTFKSSGRWQDSVGDRSKFGLTASEIVRVVETLKKHEMLDCLQLLHYHVGSQITHIRSFKQAMSESTNVLKGLAAMGVKIRFFDVGGGLGIDYDGSGSDADSSRNYSLREYADDVVWALVDCCTKHNIPQPTILSESGRALTAHHSVLIGEVVGVTSLTGAEEWELESTEAQEELVGLMAELIEGIHPENYLVRYHDAQDMRDNALTLFQNGHFSLQGRALLEKHYWTFMQAVLEISRKEEYVPDELEALELALADTYFVNFSVFQSMPDSWAIDQLFPIIPIHRLGEEPTRRAVIADLTCDSDGKISRFIDERGYKKTLELHQVGKGDPYYVGFFLVGAYQEILGDMHNLFGDTNVVHVDVDAKGRPRLSHVVRGDRVKEVLSYLEYFEEDLLRNLRRHVELALEEERMTYEDSAQFWARYERGLVGYTYLTRSNSASGTN